MCEMHFLSDIDVRIPLVVDLDGTLVLTDTLLESFIKLFFCNPLAAVRRPADSCATERLSRLLSVLPY